MTVSEFRVHAQDIPQEMNFMLSETERCMFADLLTRFGFGVDGAGDAFHHLYRKGLERIYAEHFPEDQ